MPETVTDTAIATSALGADTDTRSHLDAAREFFPSPAADGPGALDDVSPAPELRPGTTPAADSAAADEIDRGLQPPPENARSRAGWEELKKRATAERERVRQLEAKLKAGPSAVDEATRARLAELERENREFSTRLKAIDVKAHPEFARQFLAPQAEAKAALAKIAEGDEVEVDLDGLLELKGKAFNRRVSDVLETLTPYARVQFQGALDRYLAADLGAQQAVAQADDFLKNARQHTGARSREAFDRAAADYRDQFTPLAIDPQAPEAEQAAAREYNAALADVAKHAEQYAFGASDERRAAHLAHKAALYEFTMSRGLPRLGRLLEGEVARRDTRIAELEAQVKALTAAAPAVGSGAGASPAGETPGDEDHLTAARRHFPRG